MPREPAAAASQRGEERHSRVWERKFDSAALRPSGSSFLAVCLTSFGSGLHAHRLAAHRRVTASHREVQRPSEGQMGRPAINEQRATARSAGRLSTRSFTAPSIPPSRTASAAASASRRQSCNSAASHRPDGGAPVRTPNLDQLAAPSGCNAPISPVTRVSTSPARWRSGANSTRRHDEPTLVALHWRQVDASGSRRGFS